MSQSKAFILSLNKDADLTKQWDYGFLKDFLEGNLWKTYNWSGFNIKNVDSLPETDRAIVAIPARHHTDYVSQVNKELKKIDRVVLFLMGDEEAEFPADRITHPNIAIWVQNPHIDKHSDYDRIGTGYPQHLKDNLPEYQQKKTSLFFSGQVTHQRRKDLEEAIQWQPYDYVFNGTGGFTQGMNPSEYYLNMAQTKFAPAPSGAVIPDSFRLFEALECMAIPLADQVTADGNFMEYWDWLFKEITPFPKISNWFALRDILDENMPYYDNLLTKQTQWWIEYKRNFAYKVMDQLHAN